MNEPVVHRRDSDNPHHYTFSPKCGVIGSYFLTDIYWVNVTCKRCRRAMDKTLIKDMEIGQNLKCSKCGKATILTPGMKKVQTRICESCHTQRSMDWWGNNKEKARENQRNFFRSKTGRALNKRYVTNNPNKVMARNKVSYAIKTGKVKRQPCQRCGGIETHGHHEDYSKPLEVIWLCRKHHFERHKILKIEQHDDQK